MPADLPVEADLDAGHAVLFAARFGGQSFGDLGLHHHHYRSQRGEFAEQMQDGRDRDVVRQIRHHRCRLGSQVVGTDGQHVAVDHVEPLDLAVRVLGHRLRQPLGQHRVDLDGADRTATVQQCQGERAEAGADFQDVVVAVDPGGRHNPAHGVGVVNKVLPQRFTRPQFEFLGQPSDLGPPK